MAKYEVGGNSAELTGLAGDQASHHGRFDTIMTQIATNVAKVTGQWDGDGKPDHQAVMQKYHTEFSSMQDALNRMRNATDEASGKITTLGNRLVNLMSA